MKLVMQDDTGTHAPESVSPTASLEPELPDPDLIVKYENCIYRLKKNDNWDSDRRDRDTKILGDIRRLWEGNKTSNAKFRSAIEKINYALNVDLQATASGNRLSQIAVARQLRNYMKAYDAKYLDEVAKLLEHLQKVSASGKMLSEQDHATTNRIDHLVPFYKTDRTLAELESEVMASLVDNYLDNSPWSISAKLTEREDMISWVMKKLEAAGKIKLHDPAYPSFEWYDKVK